MVGTPIHDLLADQYLWHDPPTEEIAISELEDVHVYEPTDPRLKRHVIHDRRSRNYALKSTQVPKKLIAWPRVGPILDQGEIGSCTANAALGVLMSHPFTKGLTYTEADAVQLYREETRLDNRDIPGQYEPDDTGSSGLWAMKALKARGLITGYRHAFAVTTALAALANGPLAVGTIWLKSMYEPRAGVIKVDKRSGVDGGHEWVADAWDPRGYVRLSNSWGEGWGDHGSAWLSYADFSWLLQQQGDVVQPVMA